jgi:pimeloyl-ACP methyl ester carboxylesterase/DNA-binding CsgD family transcriptional regulator
VSVPALQYAKTSDGVNIAFLTVGDGPPIVFASNIFGDAHFYRQLSWQHVRGVTDGLSALGWRIVRYDVRGMGASDRIVSDLSLDARVNDLEAVVARAGIERFTIAGLDIGAATAVAYAARHVSKVSRLVLLSPWISGAEMFALPDLRVATSTRASGDREWSVFTNVLGNVVSTFDDLQVGNELAVAMRQSTTPAGLAAYYEASARIDLTDLLPALSVSTLVIHEPAFPFGSLELCQNVAKAIPKAQFVVVRDKSIAGTVHSGYVSAIDRFVRTGSIVEDVAVNAQRSPRTVTGSPLTAREIQVLAHVAAGLTNKEIAADLRIAVPTVERHVLNLYTKIGARGRVDAAAYALRHGLTKLRT